MSGKVRDVISTVNTYTPEVVMTKTEDSFSLSMPSIEPLGQDQPVQSLELTTAEIADRAVTTTSVLQEILAQGEQRHYATHWGINE